MPGRDERPYSSNGLKTVIARSEAIHGKGSDDQLDCFGAKLLAMDDPMLALTVEHIPKKCMRFFAENMLQCIESGASSFSERHSTFGEHALSVPLRDDQVEIHIETDSLVTDFGKWQASQHIEIESRWPEEMEENQIGILRVG